jgi:predicted metal-binding membrane protein
MRYKPPAVTRLARPLPTAALLLGGALAAWIITVDRMRGMDAGPGTDLGGLGWYVGIWVTMMAAMMLPSAAPMVMLFARVAADRRRRGQDVVSTAFFVAGYIAVWTVYGVGAYGLFRAITAGGTGFLAWDRAGPYVVGVAVAAAGIYELTPLKNVCLHHCRSPLHFILGGWRPGRLGAFRMGVEHGGYCVGCCWGLMVVLFAVGVMSLFWMAIVAGVIFVQKLAPRADRLGPLFAAAFVGFGIWVAAAPTSVPGLVQPNSDAAQRARMRMMHMEPRGMKPGEMKPARMRPAKQMGGMKP